MYLVHGSPPRAWGIRSPKTLLYAMHRFTPTCVGNTDAQATGPRLPMVHSHVRGEYAPLSVVNVACAVYPTCVGNTRGWLAGRASRTVHPHVRKYGKCADLFGSLWFTPTCVEYEGEATPKTKTPCGSPPACVGNTSKHGLTGKKKVVHPHVRGEYALVSSSARSGINGSPPRAWGIRSGPTRRSSIVQFTPTCVGNDGETVDWDSVGSPHVRGNTNAKRQGMPMRSVHPHVRGDHISTAYRARSVVHPHVRGEYATPRSDCLRLQRFTSRAWGIRERGKPANSRAAVYPHVRGEYWCG